MLLIAFNVTVVFLLYLRGRPNSTGHRRVAGGVRGDRVRICRAAAGPGTRLTARAGIRRLGLTSMVQRRGFNDTVTRFWGSGRPRL